MRTLLLVTVALGGCGLKLQEQAPQDPGQPDASTSTPDASPDAQVPLGNFGTPTKIAGLSLDGAAEDDLTLNGAETELIFAINLGAGNGAKNLYVSARASTAVAWGPPAAIGVLNTADSDSTPRLSADGLTLYYASTRGGASEDVWMSQRAATTAAWGTPSNLSSANSSAQDRWYMPCGGKYVVVSDRTASGDLDLYEGTVGQAASRLSISTTGATDTAPFLTADCLTLYWARDSGGQRDVVRATRATLTGAWQVQGVVSGVSSATSNEEDPWLSADGRRMYFASNADGELDLYLSTR